MLLIRRNLSFISFCQFSIQVFNGFEVDLDANKYERFDPKNIKLEMLVYTIYIIYLQKSLYGNVKS